MLGKFDDLCFILINKINNQFLGFVTIKENFDNSATIGIIGIDKKFQGQGFGSILLKYMQSYL